MKFASEDLRNEHEGILFGLQLLEEMVFRLKDHEMVEIVDFKDMVNFFKLFSDKCHHGKEEGLYFPSLEKAGVKKEGGPIGQMLLEHAEGRKYIAQMADILEHEFSAGKFTEAASDYIQLLRAHIEKENSILFVMGDQKIPEAEQAEMLEAFESFEEEVMGAGTHEKLHKMLDHLDQKYPT